MSAHDCERCHRTAWWCDCSTVWTRNPDYNGRSARLLRSVTADMPIVWSPETGWADGPTAVPSPTALDEDRCPRCGYLVVDHEPYCPDPDAS
jgi:hypothetical protein